MKKKKTGKRTFPGSEMERSKKEITLTLYTLAVIYTMPPTAKSNKYINIPLSTVQLYPAMLHSCFLD